MNRICDLRPQNQGGDEADRKPVASRCSSKNQNPELRQLSLCLRAKVHKQRPTTTTTTNEEKMSKSVTSHNRMRAKRQIVGIVCPCVSVCVPRRLRAGIGGAKQTFLRMKSNLVSHCIHRGHWGRTEQEKQDVTQRRRSSSSSSSRSEKKRPHTGKHITRCVKLKTDDFKTSCCEQTKTHISWKKKKKNVEVLL